MLYFKVESDYLTLSPPDRKHAGFFLGMILVFDAITVAIKRLFNSEALRSIFGRKAREAACRGLDVAIIAEETAHVYQYAFERGRY